MEDSMNSLIRKTISSNSRTTADNDHDESPEESSWTMYLEDFLINNHPADGHEHSNSAFSSGYYDDQSHSIISDAASLATNKLSNTNNEEVLGFGNMDRISGKRSSISKRKTKALFDDALEDTASSPVNSPKLCNQRQPSDMKPELQKDVIEMITLEKGSTSGHVDERSDELGFNGMESDCTEL